MKRLSLAILAALACVGAQAASPAFAYQGALTNEAGTEPLRGNQTVEIRLYNVATGGDPLWGRAFNVLLDDRGLFNVEVSDSAGSAIDGIAATPLERVFAGSAETTLYIGLTVSGTSGEIAPRQKLLAVPYATYAADVSRASGEFTVAGTLKAGSAAVSGSVTAASANVSGALGAATLTTTGSATVGGDLKVAGSITGHGIVPVGGVILWSGSASAIPAGWALCNGANGTPDLRNRFVVGAGDTYAVGEKGGANTVALTVAEMPRHRHSYTYSGADIADDWKNQNNFYCTFNKYGNWNTAHTEYAGEGKAHENRPPYYALCYIMRVR